MAAGGTGVTGVFYALTCDIVDSAPGTLPPLTCNVIGKGAQDGSVLKYGIPDGTSASSASFVDPALGNPIACQDKCANTVNCASYSYTTNVDCTIYYANVPFAIAADNSGSDLDANQYAYDRDCTPLNCGLVGGQPDFAKVASVSSPANTRVYTQDVGDSYQKGCNALCVKEGSNCKGYAFRIPSGNTDGACFILSSSITSSGVVAAPDPNNKYYYFDPGCSVLQNQNPPPQSADSCNSTVTVNGGLVYYSYNNNFDTSTVRLNCQDVCTGSSFCRSFGFRPAFNSLPNQCVILRADVQTAVVNPNSNGDAQVIQLWDNTCTNFS